MPYPSTSSAPYVPSHRRNTTSSKLRENRPQSTGSALPARRRRSRSPEYPTAEENIVRNEIRKRRPTTSFVPHTHPVVHPRPVQNTPAVEDPLLDRGRKGKSRHRPPSQPSEEVDTNLTEDAQNRHGVRPRRKDRSRSREAPHLHLLKAPSPDNSEDEKEDTRSFSGPLAVTEFARLKRENESLKKQIHQAEKKMGRQAKEIDRLKKELSTSQRSNSEHCLHIEKLRTQTRKTDEVVSTIEGHMNCHICMDILYKPCGLSPCGHVLCQGCLQEWFRSAPVGDDEMEDEGSADAVLYRKKICPVCRAAISTRPIPLFLVKSIAGVLEKTKGPNSAPRSPGPETEPADPWAGIFFEHAPESSDSDDDEDDSDEDEDEDEDEEEEDYDDQWSEDGYGTAEDEEHYDGPYVRPQWSPPTLNVTAEDLTSFVRGVSNEELAMLRRGVSPQMLSLFHMGYTHEEGLTALVDGANIVYLGWNIQLSVDDDSGELFMEWVAKDIHERSERWEREETHSGLWRAWKLVPAEGANEDYNTSDSDVWAADLAAESDELDFL